MARTASKSSKSAAIRQAIVDNPDKGPTELARLLRTQGIDVSNAYVSVVKTAMKKKGSAPAKRGRRPGNADSGSGAVGGSVEAAVDFVSKVGSFSEARAVLERLENLSRLVR